MHGNEDRGIRIFRRDQSDGAIAHRQVIREVNLLEPRIFADQFGRECAGLALPGDLRNGIARGPTVVVAGDSAQDVFPRLRRQKNIVSPTLGKIARQARMVGMRYEPPSGFGFEPQHVGSPREIHQSELSNWRSEMREWRVSPFRWSAPSSRIFTTPHER